MSEEYGLPMHFEMWMTARLDDGDFTPACIEPQSFAYEDRFTQLMWESYQQGFILLAGTCVPVRELENLVHKATFYLKPDVKHITYLPIAGKDVENLIKKYKD